MKKTRQISYEFVSQFALPMAKAEASNTEPMGISGYLSTMDTPWDAPLQNG